MHSGAQASSNLVVCAALSDQREPTVVRAPVVDRSSGFACAGESGLQERAMGTALPVERVRGDAGYRYGARGHGPRSPLGLTPSKPGRSATADGKPRRHGDHRMAMRMARLLDQRRERVRAGTSQAGKRPHES